jgi:predicted GTPase
MTDERSRNFLQALEGLMARSTQKRLIFFAVGRTGWGKSSTVNSLVGEEVCKVNDYEPETLDVTGYDFEVNGVKGTVFDTPGLCDGTGNDEMYINQIRSKVKDPDCMLYVTRLDEIRTENDKRVIKIISELFDLKVWENTVIVFTFANNVQPSVYEKTLNEKTRIIRQLVAECLPNNEVADRIPVVAIDNTTKRTPDGKKWLAELVTAVVERVSKEGTIALLSMLHTTLTRKDLLNKQQKAIIRRKFVDAVLQSSAALMRIGVTAAGFLSFPLIIGFSGGGIAGTLIGAWLSKKDSD